MRTCIKCKQEKELTLFAIRARGVYLNTCKDCSNEYKRIQWEANKDKHSVSRKEKRLLDPEKYRDENRIRLAKDPEKWREYHRKWEKSRKLNNKKYSLHVKISKAIAKSIKKGSKGGESWLTFVDYTLDELVIHLKKTIPQGSTWDDYINGDLHLDHIIPIAAHNFKDPTDEDFKRAWGLDNLQLLTAFDNMSKGAKIDYEFQPALAMG